MAFDRPHYKEVKIFLLNALNHPPHLYTGRDPVEWAKTFLPLIGDLLHNEDYEGAKAASDAIREFFNQFLPEGEKIASNDKLKIPEFIPLKINGIVCFVDRANPFNSRAEIL